MPIKVIGLKEALMKLRQGALLLVFAGEQYRIDDGTQTYKITSSTRDALTEGTTLEEIAYLRYDCRTYRLVAETPPKFVQLIPFRK